MVQSVDLKRGASTSEPLGPSRALRLQAYGAPGSLTLDSVPGPEPGPGEVDTSWAGSVLLRDIAEVKRLKQEDGPNLLTQGSTELVHALLADDLVDAISIYTVPVVLGGGKKLFADGSAPRSFKLTGSRVSSAGVLIGHYERDGEIKIVDGAPGSPSKREIARQARMKREG